MRTMQSLTYRKKFKCPKCGKYSLHIIHDYACECENECDLTGYNSQKIKKISIKNNFDGYYTAQEIENNFWEIDDSIINSCFNKVTDDPLLIKMSPKQKERIDSLYKKTVEIDETIDDIVVKYFMANSIKNGSELTPFSYIISLIEDIHHFLNISCNDLILFYYGIELANSHFYSGRFFFNNCIDHIAEADERIYVVLAIYYNYNFDEVLKNNRTFTIKNYLRKNLEYKSSQIKAKMDTIHGSSTVRLQRDNNTHDMNFINRQIIDDINKDMKNIDKYDKDGDQCDIEILLPRIPIMISELEKYFDLFSDLISMVSTVDFRDRKIPMLRIFSDDVAKYELTVTGYTTQFVDYVNDQMQINFNKLINFNSPYIADAFFRLGEISHCITDIFNIKSGAFYDLPYKHINFIDRQYLLYSCILRLFSCYEKVAKYLAQKIEIYSNITHFSDFENFTSKGYNVISEKIEEITTNKNYLLLMDIRNNLYHNLRLGALSGINGMDYFDNIMIQAVFENVKMIFALLNFLVPNIDSKLAANSLCPCGSLIEYNKCCKR